MCRELLKAEERVARKDQEYPELTDFTPTSQTRFMGNCEEYTEESCLSDEEYLDLDLNSGLVYLTNLKCETQTINLVPSNLIKSQDRSSNIHWCSCSVAKSHLTLL